MVGSSGGLEVSVQTPKLQTEFAVKRTTTGRHLFHMVADVLELQEHWFFGLQFTDQEGNKAWLHPEERLTSRAAHGKHWPVEFTFCVRFWPQESAWTLGATATELLFLQVRGAVLDGSLFCPPSTAIELAAYALQARCGDFTDHRLESGDLTRNRHLPQKQEGPLRGASEQWQERVVSLHRQLRGLPRRDAMHEYLQRAQQLPGYGATFFNIRCEHPLGGRSAGRRAQWFWMGVTPFGVNVYEDKVTPLLRIPWEQLRSVRYDRCKFSLMLRDRDKFQFFTRSLKQSEELLATINGQTHAITQQRKNSDGDDLLNMNADLCSVSEVKTRAEGGAGFGHGQFGGSKAEDDGEKQPTGDSPAWEAPLAAAGWLELVHLWRRQEERGSEAGEAPSLPRSTARSVDSGLASWSGSTSEVELASCEMAMNRLSTASGSTSELPLTSRDGAVKRFSTASGDSGLFRLSVTSDEVFV